MSDKTLELTGDQIDSLRAGHAVAFKNSRGEHCVAYSPEAGGQPCPDAAVDLALTLANLDEIETNSEGVLTFNFLTFGHGDTWLVRKAVTS